MPLDLMRRQPYAAVSCSYKITIGHIVSLLKTDGETQYLGPPIQCEILCVNLCPYRNCRGIIQTAHCSRPAIRWCRLPVQFPVPQ